MNKLWGNTTRHRKKGNIAICVFLLSLCAIIAFAVVYVNFIGDKKIKKPANNTNVTLSQEEKEFNSLFAKVSKLESLSKDYDEDNYQLRVLIYLRSCKYKSTQWNTLAGGEVDQNFITYVKEHEGELHEVSSLRPQNEGTAKETLNELEFTIPSTKEKVDFYHLFATLNMCYLNNKNASDLAGWAGDLVQFMSMIKKYREEYHANNGIYPSEVVLNNKILQEFNQAADYGFGSSDLCADLDAVNIITRFKASTGISLTSSITQYYKTITSNKRIQDFRSTSFTSTDQSALRNEIKTRITGTYIPFMGMYSNLVHQLAHTYGLDYEADSVVVNACIQTFANYIFSV